MTLYTILFSLEQSVSKKMNAQDTRDKELDHLKLMIDMHRHIALLSFAGLVLTSNLTINLFKTPEYKWLALVSVFSFLLCIIFSEISQLSHIDKSKDKVIYIYPLTNKFASLVGLSIISLLLGVVFLSLFILINWY